MFFFLRKYQRSCVLSFLISTMTVGAQSYRKDSLQFKSYVGIQYRSSEVKSVKLIKVLCDYCTDLQKEALGIEVTRRARIESYDSEIKLKDGDEKLAIYIRISKKDFAAIKEKED
jgi:hypothetical protein